MTPMRSHQAPRGTRRSSARLFGATLGAISARLIGALPGAFLNIIRGAISARGRLAIALNVLVASTLHPQLVRGRVTEADTRTVVAGVVVSLMRGATRASPVLTGDDGSFVLRVPAAGDWRVRADAVGYAPVLSAPLTVQLGDTIHMDIALGVRAQSLAAVVVVGETACAQNPQEGERTARVWQAIRTALDASTATERERRTPLELIISDHLLDLAGRRRATKRVTTRSWSGAGFVSLSAERLAAEGFVHSVGDSVEYAAPDAAVLTSSAFLDGHCFTVVERKPLFGRRQVGLGFVPRPDHPKADVEGTFWLDAESQLLREIEIGYRLPGRETRLPMAGAKVEYERLPNGRWYVAHWSLQMPVIREFIDPSAALPRQQLVGGREREGEARVLSIERALAASLPAQLLGRAFDSTTGRWLARTPIRLVGAGDGVTDEAGRFHFRILEPGRVPSPTRLELAGERVAALGIETPFRTVTLAPGDSLTLDLAVPPVARVHAERCAAVRDSSAADAALPGVLLGKVLTEESMSRVAGAVVVAEWGVDVAGRPSDLTDGARRQRTRASDADGQFALCGLPLDVTVTVTATVGGRRGAPIEVRLAAGWLGEEVLTAPVTPPPGND